MKKLKRLITGKQTFVPHEEITEDWIIARTHEQRAKLRAAETKTPVKAPAPKPLKSSVSASALVSPSAAATAAAGGSVLQPSDVGRRRAATGMPDRILENVVISDLSVDDASDQVTHQTLRRRNAPLPITLSADAAAAAEFLARKGRVTAMSRTIDANSQVRATVTSLYASNFTTHIIGSALLKVSQDKYARRLKAMQRATAFSMETVRRTGKRWEQFGREQICREIVLDMVHLAIQRATSLEMARGAAAAAAPASPALSPQQHHWSISQVLPDNPEPRVVAEAKTEIALLKAQLAMYQSAMSQVHQMVRLQVDRLNQAGQQPPDQPPPPPTDASPELGNLAQIEPHLLAQLQVLDQHITRVVSAPPPEATDAGRRRHHHHHHHHHRQHRQRAPPTIPGPPPGPPPYTSYDDLPACPYPLPRPADPPPPGTHVTRKQLAMFVHTPPK